MLQRTLVVGRLCFKHSDSGNVSPFSPLLHKISLYLKPGPQIGVHSDQSRACHSGGQVWLLHDSVMEGCGGVQTTSSRTFSSVTELFLLHSTSRVRTPPLQLRLQSDQSPVNHVGGQGSKLQGLFLSLGLFFLSQKWLYTTERSACFLHTTCWTCTPPAHSAEQRDQDV